MQSRMGTSGKPGSVGRVDNGDGQLSIWNVAWVARTLAVDPLHVFDANIFYPHRNTLAYSENNLGAGVLAPVGWESTQGKTPRFFALDPDGATLYVANQDSDTIVCFRVDPFRGLLTPTGQVIQTGSPSSIVFA